MKIELVTTPHQTRIYVEAPLGTNANSMRAMARKKMNNTTCPEYVNSVTGERSKGRWVQHLGSSSVWLAVMPNAVPAKRLFWVALVMPDWTK